MAQGKFALQRTAGHLFIGRALIAVNRTDQARLELAAAEKELQNVPESDPEPLMPQPRNVLSSDMAILQGEIALHDRRITEANAQLGAELQRYMATKGLGTRWDVSSRCCIRPSKPVLTLTGIWRKALEGKCYSSIQLTRAGILSLRSRPSTKVILTWLGVN